MGHPVIRAIVGSRPVSGAAFDDLGVVVGVDGSDSSLQALRWAASIARSTGANLTAVMAWHPTSLNNLATVGWAAYPGDWDPAANARSVLDRAIATVFDADVPADLTSAVLEGITAPALIEFSAEADMLVLGSRGHGGFAGLLLGSVSAACAEHAKVPVLVVHGNTSPRRGR